MNYSEYKAEHQKKIEDFCNKNCIWAFGIEQEKTALDKLGITKEQFVEDYVGFYNGAIKKTSVPEWHKLIKEEDAALKEQMANYDFAVDAFYYEINNYECFLTNDYSEALSALGLDALDVAKDHNLSTAYLEAKRKYREWAIDNI